MVVEKESEWLTGALLVPRPAALQIADRRLSLEAVAQEYGVSTEMMRFRINVTGAGKMMGPR